MASKSQSTYGDDVLNRAADELSAPAAPRRERIGERPVPAGNRDLAAILAHAPAPTKVPANFDPSSSREALIATAAYYRAQRRGFLPGHELEDWLAAEREVDRVGTASL
jgi:predicted metal-binding protein